MAAALELFSTRDAEDVSIDDVASAAGASRALVYHYFGGKQELYVAALKSAAAQLEARLRPPRAAARSTISPEGWRATSTSSRSTRPVSRRCSRAAPPTAAARSVRSSTASGTACSASS